MDVKKFMDGHVDHRSPLATDLRSEDVIRRMMDDKIALHVRTQMK